MNANEKQAIRTMTHAVSSLSNLLADFAITDESAKRALLVDSFQSKLRECDRALQDALTEEPQI